MELHKLEYFASSDDKYADGKCAKHTPKIVKINTRHIETITEPKKELSVLVREQDYKYSIVTMISGKEYFITESEYKHLIH